VQRASLGVKRIRSNRITIDNHMASIPVTIIGSLTYTDVGVGGGPMPGGPYPSHPIAPGGPPPSIWPEPGYPAHPIAPGGPPPGIWPSPGYPAHPIAPGGPPPGIWPSPGVPTHPIAPGGPPPSIWPSPGTPTHPIQLPPEAPPTEPPTEGSGGSWSYSPTIGWYWTSPGGRWVYIAGDKPAPPQVPAQPPA
jgi:hypothetical protein